MKNNFKKKSKILLLSIILGAVPTFISFKSHAQTVKTAINNGDWFDPTVWSPTGVPSALSPTDTVIINSQVSFNGTLDARGVAVHTFRISAAGSLSGTTAIDSLILGNYNYFINLGNIHSLSHEAERM